MSKKASLILEMKLFPLLLREDSHQNENNHHQSADDVESRHGIEIKHEEKLFFLEGYDNQSESNHDKSAENIEISHNLINIVIHKLFP